MDFLRQYLQYQARLGIHEVILPSILFDEGVQRMDENSQTMTARSQEKISHSSLPSTLDQLEKKVFTCTLCPLHEGRTQSVFGVGNTKAQLMFIGEAPGRDEDLQGEPFVTSRKTPH